jgi:hypothetical protein
MGPIQRDRFKVGFPDADEFVMSSKESQVTAPHPSMSEVTA